MNTYLDNRTITIESQGRRTKIKMIFFVNGPKFTKLISSNVEKKSHLLAPFSACRLLDQFQRYLRSKSRVVRNLVHLASWHYGRTCTSITSRALQNFKVIGRRSRSHGFLVFFCVRDTAITRGQYLALSKAWRSCLPACFSGRLLNKIGRCSVNAHCHYHYAICFRSNAQYSANVCPIWWQR